MWVWGYGEMGQVRRKETNQQETYVLDSLV